MRLRTIVLLVTVTALLRSAQPAIRVQARTPAGIVLGTALPLADFREEVLRSLSDRIVDQFSGSRFVTAEIAVTNGLTTPRISHAGYSYYRSAALWARSNVSSALLIAIDNNAVLLIHRPNQAIQRMVIRGADPTRLAGSSCSAEVLYIGSDLEHETVVYLQTDNDQDSAKCHQSAALLIGGSDPIHSRIRQDPWFFGSGTSFPVMYLFTTQRIATYEEWRTAPTIQCHGRATPACATSLPTMRE